MRLDRRASQAHLPRGLIVRWRNPFGISAAAAVLLSALATKPAAAQNVEMDRPLFSKGMAIYLENCSVCHGEDGHGDGRLASGFIPRPRALTTGVFKFRSTEEGDFVTKEDLFATIRNGIKGSYGQTMPKFERFSDADLEALAEVIRVASNAPKFGTAIVPPPRPSEPDLARGEELYTQLNCIRCHGENGDGQGVLAPTLLDADRLPIRPSNFTVGQFKGGNEPEDVWMRLYTGIAGTPMPNFGRNTAPEDLWSVVEYVLTFSNNGS